ncbi:MAG: hypothetical protein [Cressdnaviricota sp.]|nr:MAG: hypothetical protein [Cressdnaviricota sp.]
MEPSQNKRLLNLDAFLPQRIVRRKIGDSTSRWSFVACSLEAEVTQDVTSLIKIKLRMLELEELWNAGRVVLCTAFNLGLPPKADGWDGVVVVPERELLDFKVIYLGEDQGPTSAIALEENSPYGFCAEHWTPFHRFWKKSEEDPEVEMLVEEPIPWILLKSIKFKFMRRRLRCQPSIPGQTTWISDEWFQNHITKTLCPAYLSPCNEHYSLFEEKTEEQLAFGAGQFIEWNMDVEM